MAKNWEKALSKFLEDWKNRKEVVGAVVCGSFVTGNPSKHSDIDLQILLDKNIKWRERGNKIIDGILIEYFANPLSQNLKYFEKDYKEQSRVNAHMFTTGRILFDKNGDAKKLVETGKAYYLKKFKKINKTEIEFSKYVLWDRNDNLEEIYESDSKDFFFVYYEALKRLMEVYSQFLGYTNIQTHKMLRCLSSEKYRRKYRLEEFPDKEFSRLYLKAISIKSREKMMREYRQLINYSLKKMGGFNIDNWKARSTIEK